MIYLTGLLTIAALVYLGYVMIRPERLSPSRIGRFFSGFLVALASILGDRLADCGIAALGWWMAHVLDPAGSGRQGHRRHTDDLAPSARAP